jgi:hypothetical protein
MKFNLKSILTAAFLIAFIGLSLATTHYDQTVSKKDPDGKLVYYGTVTFADSASGAIYYTQGFYIGATNSQYAYGRCICSEAGTEDVNLFIEYSYDGENWIAGTTDTGWDAIGTTAKVDTLGIRDALLYKSALYARLKFVAGQNIGSTTLSWMFAWIKPDAFITKNFGSVFSTE